MSHKPIFSYAQLHLALKIALFLFQAHYKHIFLILKQLGLNLTLQMGSRHEDEATCLSRAEGESVTPVEHLHHTTGPRPSPRIHKSSGGATVNIFRERQQMLFGTMGFMVFKQIHHSRVINRICILMNLDEVV